MVPAVKEARELEALLSSGNFSTMYTGIMVKKKLSTLSFGVPVLDMILVFFRELQRLALKALYLSSVESRSLQAEGLCLVGYYAAATLIGVNRNAKQADPILCVLGIPIKPTTGL